MKDKTSPKKKEVNFEQSFTRLEKILEQMNSGTVSLDESLSLYEEADSLILNCNKKLQNAEKKVKILVKNREGELNINENEEPITEDFSPSSS